MGFFRRKSHGPVEDITNGDVEVRKERESRLLQKQQQQRNRLSKPKTNRSSTNLQVMMTQDATVSNKSLNTSDKEREIFTTPTNESREFLKSQIFGPESETTPVAPAPSFTKEKNGSVASLIQQLENKQAVMSSSQLSTAAPSRASRTLSGMFGSRRSSTANRASLRSRGSKELIKGGDNSPLMPTLSRDQLAEDYAPRPRREASFAPGAATRTPSGNDSSVEENEIETPATQQDEFVPAKEQISEEDLFDEPDDWMPPAHMFRSGTPANLDYTHLGGLRLGSLHVVNGRASPAMSELSKHLIKSRLQARPRDASSQYGGSEDGTVATEQWEDMEVVDDEAGDQRKASRPIHQNQNRHFSFEFEDEKKMNRKEKLQNLDPIITSPPQTPRQKAARDRTSCLADSYIAELPLSPYAPSSPSSDAGSVRHHEGRSGSRSFEDEALCVPQERQIESKVSWYSSAESDLQKDDVFMSAVELQAAPSTDNFRPEMPERSSAQSDSGYSSNTSLRKTAQKFQDAVVHQTTTSVVSTPVIVRREFRLSADTRDAQAPTSPSTVMTASTIKPSTTVLESPTSVTTSFVTSKQNSLPPPTPVKLTVPISTVASQSAEIVPATPTSSSNQTEKSSPKLAKARKRLQKPRRKSTADAAKELVVQGADSTEIDTVPPITNFAETNLATRSVAVPELEKTVHDENALKNRTSTFFVPDMRFPSPAPEAQQNSKGTGWWSRTARKERSKSRPRTWFGKPKEQDDRQVSAASNHASAAAIGDLGDVIDSLGTNPYDIASIGPRPHTNHAAAPSLNSSPHNISSQAPRPKSMMDDRAAIQFSKLRSRSIQERENMGYRRSSSFNDRGGIPGKNLRPASMGVEAPPLPPMPNREEIERRISSRHDSHSNYHNTPKSGTRFWTETLSSEPDSSPAPPPPAHYTLPMYVHQDEIEDEPEDEIPPPPPCHSPRPRDITPVPQSVEEDMWADQAATWRAKRESAGNVLRRSWEEHQYEEEYLPQEQEHFQQQEEPLYPDIPLRNGSKWESQRSPDPTSQGHAAEIWADQDYQNALRDYFSHQQPAAPPHRPLPNPRQSQASLPTSSFYGNDDYSQPQSRARSRSPGGPRSRPQSAHSFASSLAEELHPADMRRKSPAPDFGRYSGGLEYGYEGREKGFGGSAGTRSVSGKADGKRRSGANMNSYGLDFSDIPAMGVPMGAVGMRFKYQQNE